MRGRVDGLTAPAARTGAASLQTSRVRLLSPSTEMATLGWQRLDLWRRDHDDPSRQTKSAGAGIIPGRYAPSVSQRDSNARGRRHHRYTSARAGVVRVPRPGNGTKAGGADPDKLRSAHGVSQLSLARAESG